MKDKVINDMGEVSVVVRMFTYYFGTPRTDWEGIKKEFRLSDDIIKILMEDNKRFRDIKYNRYLKKRTKKDTRKPWEKSLCRTCEKRMTCQKKINRDYFIFQCDLYEKADEFKL